MSVLSSWTGAVVVPRLQGHGVQAAAAVDALHRGSTLEVAGVSDEMLGMGRRTFLKGVGVLGAFAVMPGTLARMLSWPQRPILWGDGVHDDAPGLQALVDGRDVDVRDPATRMLDDGTFFLAGGTYLVKDTVRFPTDGPRGTIYGSTFTSDGGDGPMFRVEWDEDWEEQG
jgi:hypothetical protein